MTLKPLRNPYGFRELLVYKKADAVQSHCALLTTTFPPLKTLYALSDQMNRSARSTKQNIVEGWKRNSTKEYYEFLGYAVASNAELEEDATDIWKEHYKELMGLKGVMGERSSNRDVISIAANGREGENGEMGDIESIPFYPLDPLLPPVVQLKLMCKELNFLLEKLQKSLIQKMELDHTLPTAERIRRNEQVEEEFDIWLEKQRKGLKG
jgi:four helix bundle protein